MWADDSHGQSEQPKNHWGQPQETAESAGPTDERIVVDEDWKARVEKEKQESQKQRESSPSAGEGDPPLPPPTLTGLASSFSMQALAALGLLPDPLTGKVEVRLNRARHLIDTINLLYEKTSGNITPEEKQALEQMLHELRLAFVQIQSAQKRSS
ncbi:DUF1844 domain-containing protein [Thermogutta sp.]|jgi:hypothetical protein|uniref:DUF1844 domain-containing protein n=1 Tax=Thermogutta sp. TaxID=1962930 RepID=UPI00321F79EC